MGAGLPSRRGGRREAGAGQRPRRRPLRGGGARRAHGWVRCGAVPGWLAGRPPAEGEALLGGPRGRLACCNHCVALVRRFLPPAGEWRAFTGNEIGAMLAEWVLRSYRRRQAAEGGAAAAEGGQKLAVLSSTVSSRMLQAIAEAEGVLWDETLTGGCGVWGAGMLVERHWAHLPSCKQAGQRVQGSTSPCACQHLCCPPVRPNAIPHQGSSGSATGRWSWRRKGGRRALLRPRCDGRLLHCRSVLAAPRPCCLLRLPATHSLPARPPCTACTPQLRRAVCV